MIIRKYGITLHRLKEEHIELVRQKRNEDATRQFMFYQKIITPEMQQKWFESISNIYNYYFVIEYKNTLIGLVNGKNNDFEKKTSEGGMFIWDENYWATFVPVIASVCMADLSFILIKLEKTFAEVQSKNNRVKEYNKEMGYVLHKEIHEQGKQIYVLTRENYFAKAKKIREAVMKVGKDNTPISWDDIDFSQVTAKEKLQLYTGGPDYLQKEVNPRIRM